jgi:hypothetical protein
VTIQSSSSSLARRSAFDEGGSSSSILVVIPAHDFALSACVGSVLCLLK